MDPALFIWVVRRPVSKAKFCKLRLNNWLKWITDSRLTLRLDLCFKHWYFPKLLGSMRLHHRHRRNRTKRMASSAKRRQGIS